MKDVTKELKKAIKGRKGELEKAIDELIAEFNKHKEECKYLEDVSDEQEKMLTKVNEQKIKYFNKVGYYRKFLGNLYNIVEDEKVKEIISESLVKEGSDDIYN